MARSEHVTVTPLYVKRTTRNSIGKKGYPTRSYGSQFVNLPYSFINELNLNDMVKSVGTVFL